MSSIVTCALNLTFGLLWQKVRDHTANELKGGDLTDEKCRELIVREIDDIKTKLDGLARKDLLSSISFLKEGLCLLNLSLDKSKSDETSFVQEKKEDLSQGEASKMMVAGCSKLGEDSVLNEAWSLIPSEAIAKLKIASEECFLSAKASFKTAREKSTEALSNEALSTEDRILATKLRVISRILESLEDPEAAANTCKLYLKELHDVPAVKEMFSVYLGGGIKSRLNKKKRLENVVSVTMINLEVFNFTKKFTKSPSFFNWPTIDLGERAFHHPLSALRAFGTFGVQTADNVIPKEIHESVILWIYAVNSKGEIIALIKEGKSYNVVKITAGEVQIICSLPQEEMEVYGFEILTWSIDGEDNIYILSKTSTDQCKLFVFDETGSMKYNSLLEFLNGDFGFCTMAVTNGKKIFIHARFGKQVYVCDSTGQMKCSFPLEKESYFKVCLSISDENEIIAAPSWTKFVYIYTEEGKLKKRFEVPQGHEVLRMAFNYVTKEVIVVTENKYCYYLSRYWKTGEQRQTVSLPCFMHNIISHPSGPVAIFHSNEVFFIQK